MYLRKTSLDTETGTRIITIVFLIMLQAIKRKLDDIGRKLAILYDLLRESKVCSLYSVFY